MATNINQTLEDLIAAISGLAGQSEACCEVGGQQIDDPPSDGTVVYGEGEDYPDAESYFNAKCSSANGIYDTVVGTVDWLRDNNVDLKAGVLGSVTTAIILGLALSGPVGWAIQLSGVVITVLAGFIIKSVIDFIDMLDGLDDVHEELVLALYNAGNTETARENFLTLFDGATPGPSAIELTLARLLLPGTVLNQLFVPRPDVGSYESPDPIDCGTAPLALWSWSASLESWTFRDDSTNNGVAAMSWDSTDEALAFALDMPGGMVHTKAIGVGISPTISIPVDVGNSVQLEYSLPQRNNYETWKTIRVFFTDATQDEITIWNTSAGTLILSILEAKTIEKVEAVITLYSGVTSLELHETIDVYEVRIQ